MAGGLALALVRAGFEAALLCVCGGLVFRVRVEPRAMEGVPASRAWPVERALAWWIWVSLGLAFAGIAGWALLDAAIWSGAGDRAHGRFVSIAMEQLALMVVTACLVGAGRNRVAAVVATAAVAAQAGHGHATGLHGAMRLLVGIDVLHLVAAAVWLGGLMPLLLVVRRGRKRQGRLRRDGFRRSGNGR